MIVKRKPTYQEVIKLCNKKDKEIERLNSLWETDRQSWNELMAEKETEIERLNNIINEFEEELKWQRKVCLSLNEKFTISRIDTLIDKLQELKDRDKE